MNKENNGIITTTGKFGDIAYLYTCDSPEFLNNIEEGIKPLVLSLVNNGYDTCSSCQGHNDNSGFFCLPNVVFKVFNDRDYFTFKALSKRFLRFKNLQLDLIEIIELDYFSNIKAPLLKINFKLELADENRSEVNKLLLEYSLFMDEYFKSTRNR